MGVASARGVPVGIDDVVTIALQDPAEGLRVAAAFADDPDPRVRSIAARAEALALRQQRHLPDAVEALERAVNDGELSGDRVVAGQARLSLATTLLAVGQLPEAERLLDALIDGADGLLQADAMAQRAGLRQRKGDEQGALADYRTAVPVLRRLAPPSELADTLMNRALFQAELGQLADAEQGVRDALATYESGGDAAGAADAWHNLGYVLGRVGRLAESLRCFDEAERRYEAIGVDVGTLPPDRCDALLLAGLTDDARVAAQRAVAAHRDGGAEVDLAESHLLLSRVEAAAGRADGAARAAKAAADLFAAQGRAAWAMVAQLQLAHVEIGRDQPDRIEALALELDAAGAHGRAVEAWILTALAAVSSAQYDRAAAALERSRRGGNLMARLQRALARARLAAELCEHRRARRIAGQALDTIEQLRDLLSSTELRAGLSGTTRSLVEVGVGSACATGRPGTVLAWVERGRAAALRPAGPADDRGAIGAAAPVDELRRLVIAEQGETDPGALLSLAARRQRAEAQIRRFAWSSERSSRGAATPVRLEALRAAVPDHAIVSMFVARGRLGAVVMCGRRTELVDLADVQIVHALRDVASAAVRRVALADGRGEHDDVGTANLIGVLGAIDAHLAGALKLGDAPAVVLSPPAELDRIPWSALPTLVGRPICVAPRLGLLLGSGGRRGPIRRVSCIAAAAVDHVGELTAVRAAYPNSVVVEARRAADARAAFGSADIVHASCHGRLRADNPMFSWLSLDDGPLYAHELEPVAAAPHVVVLTACEAAASVHPTQDEALGFATVLLGAGVGTVIASAFPVPERPWVTELVATLHRQLAAGTLAHVALERALAAVPGGDRLLASALFAARGRLTACIAADAAPSG